MDFYKLFRQVQKLKLAIGPEFPPLDWAMRGEHFSENWGPPGALLARRVADWSRFGERSP